MFGLFGDLFDFNHDGKLDGFERAAEFAIFSCIMEDNNKDCSDLDDAFGGDDYDDNFDDDY